MAKKSRKHHAQYEKDQSGCIKSLINNIFDFRQGRSSQKVLQDKKHESKRISGGVTYPDIKLESLSEPSEIICKELTEEMTIDAGKMSVKELMNEEMIGEDDKKKETPSGDVAKNRRRTRSMASINLGAEVSVSGNPSHRRHKSLNSIYLSAMVEELCSQINHKDGEALVTRVTEDPSLEEEKLWEATEMLISQFSDGKRVTKDGKIQASRELIDALRIIDSNKQEFLRLLQDPDSELVKRIQTIQDVQVEEGKFKVITGSKKNDSSEDLNRIVVLKPGPPVLGNSGVEEKEECNRVSSTFSFSELKRKLKHVMRKTSTVNKNMSSRERRVGGGESGAMASPSRDHFFIERLPKSPLKITKPKEDGTYISPEQRVSNIYIEAKKHLAEVIGINNVDGTNTSPRKQVPRSLGGLMSFSGYTSPTLHSPRKEGECQTVENTCQIKPDSDKICLQAPEVDILLMEPISDVLPACESKAGSNAEKSTHEFEATSLEDIVTSPNGEPQIENKPTDSTNAEVDSPSSSKSSDENCQFARLGQDSCSDSEPSSSSEIASSLTGLVTEKSKDQELTCDATSKPSPISVLEPLFSEDDVSPYGTKSLLTAAGSSVQPRQIQFEEETSTPSEQYDSNRTFIDEEKHIFDFVKAVVQMSGLTWDEAHRLTLFSGHLVDMSLLDEIDFLPDLLPCDFNLLFDLINEVVIDISWVNFGSMIPFVKPAVHPSLKDKDIFTEIWKGVEQHLKLEEEFSHNNDQIVLQDLEKPGFWLNTRPDSETIGIQLQEVILEELVEDAILSCISLF